VTFEDIRKTKTSDLIAYLNPEIIIAGLGDIDLSGEQVDAFIRAIAAEIDRRIPVPT
jgi:hypothetical protein